MESFTVVALVRPWEIPWEDAGAVGSAICVDWVEASSAEHARAAFTIALARRTGLGLDDAPVIAVFPGHLTEGDSPTAGSAGPPDAAKRGAKAVPGDGPTMVSVKQFMDRHACFTLAWLRQMLFHREANGLADAVVQCGRKIVIDEAKFFAWLEARQGRGAARNLPMGKHGRGGKHQPLRGTGRRPRGEKGILHEEDCVGTHLGTPEGAGAARKGAT